MKAVVYKDYTANIEIIDIEKPKLQDKSVLVEVHAASINPIDNILHAGYLKEMLELSFPHVMGYDVSGKVIEVGKDVLNVKVGDEVFARPNQEDAGSIAEFARIQENELAIKPENLSHIDAASVPLAGLTAWQALVTKGNIKQGDKVLIHAGSGGVGTLAIQIAKHFGATVATTTSSKNIELVKSLGADLIIDYTTQSFEDDLSDYDLVFDMIGGDVLAKSFKVLKKGGTLISIKGQDTENRNTGGGGPDIVSQETRDKISNHPTRGQQISKSSKGMGKSHKGKPFSEEHKAKIKATRGHLKGRANTWQAKPVLQYDLEGNFIREFGSQTEAQYIMGKTGDGNGA